MDSYLVTEWFDEQTGARGYLSLDRVVGGLAGGGIRMRPGVTKEEVQRLARTMTLKLIGLEMPIGGAKAGIDYDPLAPDATDVLARFIEAHLPILRHTWGASEDMGTSKDQIVAIVRELGMTTAVDAFFEGRDDAATVGKDLATALSLTINGTPITDIVTGAGVAASAEEAMKFLNLPITETRVAIQGFGSVGASTAQYLHTAGAKIVAISDVFGTISHPDGLDIDLLLTLKDAKGNVDRTQLPNKYVQLEGAEWMNATADVLIPAAIADAIHSDNVDRVNAKLIVEGANIPTTADAEATLIARGVTIVPDFIANSAGAGLFGSMLYKNVEPTADAILTSLRETLAQTTRTILENAANEGITPRQAAEALEHPDFETVGQ